MPNGGRSAGSSSRALSMHDEKVQFALTIRGLLVPVLGPFRQLALPPEAARALATELRRHRPALKAPERQRRPYWANDPLGQPDCFFGWLTCLIDALRPRPQFLLREWALAETLFVSRWSNASVPDFPVLGTAGRFRGRIDPADWKERVVRLVGTLEPRSFESLLRRAAPGGASNHMAMHLRELAGIDFPLPIEDDRRLFNALRTANLWLEGLTGSVDERRGRGRAPAPASPRGPTAGSSFWRAGRAFRPISLFDLLDWMGEVLQDDTYDQVDPLLIASGLGGSTGLAGEPATPGASALVGASIAICGRRFDEASTHPLTPARPRQRAGAARVSPQPSAPRRRVATRR